MSRLTHRARTVCPRNTHEMDEYVEIFEIIFQAKMVWQVPRRVFVRIPRTRLTCLVRRTRFDVHLRSTRIYWEIFATKLNAILMLANQRWSTRTCDHAKPSNPRNFSSCLVLRLYICHIYRSWKFIIFFVGFAAKTASFEEILSQHCRAGYETDSVNWLLAANNYSRTPNGHHSSACRNTLHLHFRR